MHLPSLHRRPRTLLAAFALFTLSLLLAGYFLWRPRPHETINDESLARIQPGMTRAEVEAIVGGPARNESVAQDNTVWNDMRVDAHWGDYIIPVVFLSPAHPFASKEEAANYEKARQKGAEIFKDGKYLLVWHHDQAIISVVFDGATDTACGARLWKPQEKSVWQMLRERWFR